MSDRIGWADQVHREGPCWSPLTPGAEGPALSHPAPGPGDKCCVGGRVQKIEPKEPVILREATRLEQA